jgi:hypothetical protein
MLDAPGASDASAALATPADNSRHAIDAVITDDLSMNSLALELGQ